MEYSGETVVRGYRLFVDSIEKVCNHFSDKVAVAYMRENGDITYTSYKEILFGCRRVKEMLKNAGIVAGDRIAIISPHSPQAVLSALGGAYANVTTVLIDATLPKNEINRLLDFADVQGLFITEEIYPCIEKEQKEQIPMFKLCKQENEYVLFEDSLSSPQKEKTIDPEKDVIAILFSSGTTASMKGIKITYESVLKASEIFVRNVEWKSKYKYLHVFPLNHIAGYATVQAFLSCGSELGMIENMTASKLQKALLTYEPHGFGMIPKVFEMMEDKVREGIRKRGILFEKLVEVLLRFSGWIRKRYGIKIGKIIFGFLTKQVFGKNITTIGTGASLCRKSTSQFFIDLGLDWANFYALTETNVPAVSTGIFDRYPVLMAGNVKRNPEIEIRINNPDDAGIGEIYVKSKLLMKGYFRDSELTKRSYDGEYFKTGDYGYIDTENNLYVTGRVKESILLHNGKKISPTDVENYYSSFVPDIEIACCGCLKEGASYDEVHMFIQSKNIAEKEIQEIIEKINYESQRVNTLYKIDYIHKIDKIPLTSVGKVKRFELQAWAKANKEESDISKRASENQSAEEIIIEAIKDIVGKNNNVNYSSKLQEDLGFDSLSIYELETQIEMQFDLSISEQWTDLETVGDLISLVMSMDSKEQKKQISKTTYPLERNKRDMVRLRALMWILERICRVEYRGCENLLENKPCIYAPNHSSHLDAICVYKGLYEHYGRDTLDKVCCLAAEELGKKGYMKKIFRSIGAIPINRNGNAILPLKQLYTCISKKRYSAIVFPEGTRTRDGKMGEFREGIAAVSLNTGIPIIPVGINGTFEVWSPDRKYPKFMFKRPNVVVTFGKPIIQNDISVSELTKFLKEEVRKQYEVQI